MKPVENLITVNSDMDEACAELRRIIESSTDPQRLVNRLLPIARQMLAEQERLQQPKTPEIG